MLRTLPERSHAFKQLAAALSDRVGMERRRAMKVECDSILGFPGRIRNTQIVLTKWGQARSLLEGVAAAKYLFPVFPNVCCWRLRIQQHSVIRRLAK